MVLFFFIGTGKLLKEAAAKRPDAAGRDYILARVREFKTRTSALARSLRSRRSPPGLLGVDRAHGQDPGLAASRDGHPRVLLHVVAFGREVVAMAETNQLMDEAATLVPPAPEPSGAGAGA